MKPAHLCILDYLMLFNTNNMESIPIKKGKNKLVANYVNAFLEECRVQKLFFSGQMSMEEYIGMKKKAPK